MGILGHHFVRSFQHSAKRLVVGGGVELRGTQRLYIWRLASNLKIITERQLWVAWCIQSGSCFTWVSATAYDPPTPPTILPRHCMQPTSWIISSSPAQSGQQDLFFQWQHADEDHMSAARSFKQNRQWTINPYPWQTQECRRDKYIPPCLSTCPHVNVFGHL